MTGWSGHTCGNWLSGSCLRETVAAAAFLGLSPEHPGSDCIFQQWSWQYLPSHIFLPCDLGNRPVEWWVPCPLPLSPLDLCDCLNGYHGRNDAMWLLIWVITLASASVLFPWDTCSWTQLPCYEEVSSHGEADVPASSSFEVLVSINHQTSEWRDTQMVPASSQSPRRHGAETNHPHSALLKYQTCRI